LKNGVNISPTKGRAKEVYGAMLKLENPRARFSRTEKRGRLYSCLGELLWYLAGRNDLKFIRYYISQYRRFSDDGCTVYGGYGPRLFGMNGANQVKNVIAILKRRPNSRQAVIQLFRARDIQKKRNHVPCTCTLQFVIRGRQLHMMTSMRSNDAYLGLPHDIFAFTMFQEILACSLHVKLGGYTHSIGSLHLYNRNHSGARRYIAEGWQSRIAMPPMPPGDPWSSIKKVLKAESVIRSGRVVNMAALKLPSYWSDLVRILQCYQYAKSAQRVKFERTRAGMSSKVYSSCLPENITRTARSY